MEQQPQQPILIQLTDEQMRTLANMAAEPASDLAVEKLFATVGRVTIKRALWIIGLGVSALLSAALAVLFHK